MLVVIPSFLLFYFDQYPVTSSRDGMKRTSMTVVVSIGAVADASIFSIVAAPRRNIGLDDRSGRRNRSKKKKWCVVIVSCTAMSDDTIYIRLRLLVVN